MNSTPLTWDLILDTLRGAEGEALQNKDIEERIYGKRDTVHYTDISTLTRLMTAAGEIEKVPFPGARAGAVGYRIAA